MQPLAKNSVGLWWLYGGITVFAIAACIGFVSEVFWILLLPAVILVIVTGIYRMDLLMLFAVVVTPLSINLSKTGLGIGVSLPSEPIIFGIMLLFVFKTIANEPIDKKILSHPVTLAIIFHLLWMTITTLTSSLPLVSFKATLARYCFVLVYYFLAIQMFKNIKNIKIFSWCYLIPLMIIIFYTTLIHASQGFSEQAAHTSMVPFYNDHTAYAAMIAMFIPLIFGYIADKDTSINLRIWAFVALLILISAIVLSYTRASWISLVAALLCYLVFLLRIKTAIIISGIVTVVAFIFIFQTQIIMELEQNEEQSSSDYASHVESMSNISTDASNVERINRWHSAFRLFDDRPWFGWGPGTYMFQYAPYQKWSERTYISTNFGEGGNAHSEFIGPLAEQGILGPIAFILIGIFTIYRASRMIIYSKDKRVRILAKGLILGLITYWIHGMLNNFLDTEKASVPFWAFIAGIVALDVYHFREKESFNDQKTNLSGNSNT
ncbi:MAG: O-antigen ligase family protein [Bacteroidetes bacterium]|nr:O-antigen ligase family protein [Bacteroidota bacterium]